MIDWKAHPVDPHWVIRGDGSKFTDAVARFTSFKDRELALLAPDLVRTLRELMEEAATDSVTADTLDRARELVNKAVYRDQT